MQHGCSGYFEWERGESLERYNASFTIVGNKISLGAEALFLGSDGLIEAREDADYIYWELKIEEWVKAKAETGRATSSEASLAVHDRILGQDLTSDAAYSAQESNAATAVDRVVGFSLPCFGFAAEVSVKTDSCTSCWGSGKQQCHRASCTEGYINFNLTEGTCSFA